MNRLGALTESLTRQLNAHRPTQQTIRAITEELEHGDEGRAEHTDALRDNAYRDYVLEDDDCLVDD
jgi:hypothetical protein